MFCLQKFTKCLKTLVAQGFYVFNILYFSLHIIQQIYTFEKFFYFLAKHVISIKKQSMIELRDFYIFCKKMKFLRIFFIIFDYKK